MYTNKSANDNNDIMEFIESSDVFNSKYIYQLDNMTNKNHILISRAPKRLDILSLDIYGNNK